MRGTQAKVQSRSITCLVLWLTILPHMLMMLPGLKGQESALPSQAICARVCGRLCTLLGLSSQAGSQDMYHSMNELYASRHESGCPPDSGPIPPQGDIGPHDRELVRPEGAVV